MTPEQEHRLREKFAEAIAPLNNSRRTDAWECFNALIDREAEQLDCSDYEIILEALVKTDLSQFCSAATAVNLIAKLKPVRDRVCRR